MKGKKGMTTVFIAYKKQKKKKKTEAVAATDGSENPEGEKAEESKSEVVFPWEKPTMVTVVYYHDSERGQ